MAYASDIHVAVYQVLDQLLTAHVPPPGAKAAIHSIIDDLQAASASRDMLLQAQNISLEMHKLETAIARRSAEDAAVARQQLRRLAGAWLNHRISNCC